MGSIRAFADRIDSNNIFAMQNGQYTEKLVMTDTVPASSQKMCKVSVSSLGNFLCLLTTGKFSTLYSVDIGGGLGVQTIDDGINHLSGQLIDGAGQKKLFNDFIPFDILFSPGRVKDITAFNTYAPAVSGGITYLNTADASPQLFYPSELEYMFTANSDIIMDVKNNSNVALPFSICFHGIRVLSSTAVRGLSSGN